MPDPSVPFVHGPHPYDGSCHCGAVRFRVTLDLDGGTTRCNCTWCTKTGWWGSVVQPAAFELLAGEDDIEKITENPVGHRLRCRTCGLVTHGVGDLPELGGAFVSINVRCLDGVDLAGSPVAYLDGLHDTWQVVLAAPWVDPFAARPS